VFLHTDLNGSLESRNVISIFGKKCTVLMRVLKIYKTIALVLTIIFTLVSFNMFFKIN